MNKPDIDAEMMVLRDELTGKIRFRALRYEVFDLPALEGTDNQCELAGEIMAVATSDAGDGFHKLAWERVPDGFPTQKELDDLNAELAKKVDVLASAVADLTDAKWWIDHQDEFDENSAYRLIVQAALPKL